MLAAFSLLCIVGLRYPLQMLPVLLWEVTWKTLWLVLMPLPQWMAGRLDQSLGPAASEPGSSHRPAWLPRVRPRTLSSN